MKKLVLFLLLICAVFAGSYSAARWKSTLQPHISGENAACDRFAPNPFPLQNRPFAIVIIGRNHGASLEKTLASVFSQNYENYRVVYIDDASDDGSFDLASDLIFDHCQSGHVTSVRNEQKLGKLANIARAVESCTNEEIVLVLDGEDWLAHEWVLQRLNSYYSDPDLWMAFSQTREYPFFQPAVCQIEPCLKDKKFRSDLVLSSQAFTFYAALFKKIHPSDFIFQGQYFPAGEDLAYTIPMLEMASEHVHLIPEVLTISNKQNSCVPEIPEILELQVQCEKWIRSLTPYPVISTLFLNDEWDELGEIR